jgi:hypothetical protein
LTLTKKVKKTPYSKKNSKFKSIMEAEDHQQLNDTGDQPDRQNLTEYPKYAYERDRLMRNDSEKSIDVNPKDDNKQTAHLDRAVHKKKSRFEQMTSIAAPDSPRGDGPHPDDVQIPKKEDPDADGVPESESPNGNPAGIT